MEQCSLKLAEDSSSSREDAQAVRKFHMAAIIGDNLEALKQLIDSKAVVDVNVKDKIGFTALHYALNRENKLEGGSMEMVKTLIHAGADVNTGREFGTTALHLATKRNDCSFIEYLVSSRGADVNVRDKLGRTPLHYCRYNSGTSREAIEVLLKNGADVNAQDKDGNTPVLVSQPGMLELFLNHGVNVNVKNNSGFTLLMEAVRCSNLKNVQLLIDLGSKVNDSSRDRSTPLHRACLEGNIETVELLIKNGASVSALNSRGETPFHAACKCGDVEIVKFLLENGANVDQTGPRGTTPLRMARDYDAFETVKFFIENGVGMDLFGKTADELRSMFYGKSIAGKRGRFWNKKILEHIAILRALDAAINPDILDYISSVAGFKEYFERCKSELDMAKSIKLPNSWVTFFSLLVYSRKKLKNYAGNQDLVRDFENSDCLGKFPIFGPTMHENMSKGINRRKLFDEASVLFSDCVPVFNPNHLIVRDVLDFINTKNLSKLIQNN